MWSERGIETSWMHASCRLMHLMMLRSPQMLNLFCCSSKISFWGKSEVAPVVIEFFRPFDSLQLLVDYCGITTVNSLPCWSMHRCAWQEAQILLWSWLLLLSWLIIRWLNFFLNSLFMWNFDIVERHTQGSESIVLEKMCMMCLK